MVKDTDMNKDLQDDIVVFDIGIGFALSHTNPGDTRRAVEALSRDFTKLRTQLAPELKDAARYRGLRAALVNQDETFFERMEQLCPSLSSEDEKISGEEWDNALDTVLGLK
jgi:hypothetical protein